MKASRALRQSDILEFIGTLFGGDLHAKRVLSLANGTPGVLTSASLAVHAIGQGLAHAQGTLSKHGVKQVDRLLSNQGIEVDALFERWVPYVIGARKAVVVAMDWTSFAGDGHETLVLSMLTRHGRATPLLWRTVEAKTLKGQQSAYEDALLCRLYDVVPEGVAVTVVADRGFCRLPTAETAERAAGVRLRGAPAQPVLCDRCQRRAAQGGELARGQCVPFPQSRSTYSWNFGMMTVLTRRSPCARASSVSTRSATRRNGPRKGCRSKTSAASSASAALRSTSGARKVRGDGSLGSEAPEGAGGGESAADADVCGSVPGPSGPEGHRRKKL